MKKLKPYVLSLKHPFVGNSLEVQWLAFITSTVGGTGFIPGPGTTIPQAVKKNGKHSFVLSFIHLFRELLLSHMRCQALYWAL